MQLADKNNVSDTTRLNWLGARAFVRVVVGAVLLAGCSFGATTGESADGSTSFSTSLSTSTETQSGQQAAVPDTSTDASTTSSTTTSSVAPSTTVAWTRGAERAAWEDFIDAYEVLDTSEFSRGPCGVFAMMLTEGSVTFYWWNGREWVDRSSLLVGGQGDKPAKVYTRDFTLDGVPDFFVEYEPSRDYRGRSYGSFFAYPWTHEQQCQWTWIDVDDGRDLGKRVVSPDVDQRAHQVYGTGYVKGRWGSYGVYEFLGSSSSFVFRQTSRSQDN